MAVKKNKIDLFCRHFFLIFFGNMAENRYLCAIEEIT